MVEIKLSEEAARCLKEVTFPLMQYSVCWEYVQAKAVGFSEKVAGELEENGFIYSANDSYEDPCYFLSKLGEIVKDAMLEHTGDEPFVFTLKVTA